MSTLHIFAKPAHYYAANGLENLINNNDNILLVSDACYSAKQFRQFADTLYILSEDAHARSITIDESDIAINYATFVDLTLNSNNTISW